LTTRAAAPILKALLGARPKPLRRPWGAPRPDGPFEPDPGHAGV